MTGARTRSRGVRYAGVAAIVLAVLVVAAGMFFLIGPIVSATRAVTGGRWGADLAVGIGFVLLPLAIIIGYAVLAHHRGWRQRYGWWLLVLYIPAFDLEPFSRAGTDTQLEHRLDTQLPGLLGGMGIGAGVLAACVAVLYVMAKQRQRRA